MLRVLAGLLLALCACGRVSFTPVGVTDGMAPDACTFGPWSSGTAVTATSSAEVETDPTLTPDGTTLFFSRSGELYMSTRASPTGAFGSPTQMTSFSSATRVAFSLDGVEAYYQSGASIWHARYLGGGQFADASALPDLGVDVAAPSVSGDGTELYLSSSQSAPTSRDLYRAHRLGPTTFEAPQPVAELNTGSYDAFSSISSDDLAIYFESNRDGPSLVYAATRTERSLPFDAPAALDLGGDGASEGDPWISTDGRELYFIRGNSGDYDLFVAVRACE
jgi:Tol biopolymer transport system component